MQRILYLLVTLGGNFHVVNVQGRAVFFFGHSSSHWCSRGAHCFLCFPVTVNIQAGLVLKAFVPDVVILMARDMVERGSGEIFQQLACLLNKPPLGV